MALEYHKPDKIALIQRVGSRARFGATYPQVGRCGVNRAVGCGMQHGGWPTTQRAGIAATGRTWHGAHGVLGGMGGMRPGVQWVACATPTERATQRRRMATGHAPRALGCGRRHDRGRGDSALGIATGHAPPAIGCGMAGGVTDANRVAPARIAGGGQRAVGRRWFQRAPSPKESHTRRTERPAHQLRRH